MLSRKSRDAAWNGIFVVSVDVLKGFPYTTAAVFPHADVQRCLVHMARHSLKFANRKQGKYVAADLKALYTAMTVEVRIVFAAATIAERDGRTSPH